MKTAGRSRGSVTALAPFEPALAPDEDAVRRINFSWIVQLRWAAVVGQTVTVAVVHGPMGIELPVVPLSMLIAFEAVTNVFCVLWLRKRRPVTEWMLVAVMTLDLCLFTALLYFSGGPFNPFSSLYLVHLALAAIVLSPRWTWMLVALAVLGNAGLFLEHVPLPMDHGMDDGHAMPGGHEGHAMPGGHEDHAMPGGHGDHGEPLGMHLRGMWVAFGVTAGFIVYFLHRVSRALAQREAELRRVREQTSRSERLASVATLAAGAAHELATPLSTIAVIAKELERQHDGATTSEDARIIRKEVDRCRDILRYMAGDAGESPGEAAAPVALQAIVERALEGLPDRSPIDVEWVAGTREAIVVAPLRAVAQALRGVLKNAIDASPEGGRVTLRVEQEPALWRFVVLDRGEGMTPETAVRATEPFFTTKETGKGMGLGLFLAQSVVDFLGGALEIHSTRGEGTRVALTLPATIRHMAENREAGAA